MDKVATRAKIQLTIEIDWDHSFGEKATAIDIYTTAARECENIIHRALAKDHVSYRIIGEIQPMMVIVPTSAPKSRDKDPKIDVQGNK